jgi:peptide/nickel transport system permease protein
MSIAINRLHTLLQFFRIIAARILAVLPVIAIVTILIFLLIRLAEGDPAAVIGGDFSDVETLNEIRAAMGLDLSLLSQFWQWSTAVLSGNLGYSLFSRIPVSELIGQRAGPTLSLTLCTLAIVIPVSLVTGLISAKYANKKIDYAVMLLTVAGFSIPVFVLGYALVFVFSMTLHWLPVQGYQPFNDHVVEFFQYMLLPALTLSVTYIALLSRVIRSSLLDVLNENFIRTVQSQGMSNNTILLTKALKNAAIPAITVLGTSVSGLLGGAVVIEHMFNIPGIGSLLIDAVSKRDYPVIQGILLILSFVYVVINFVVDLTYTWLDPRIRS